MIKIENTWLTRPMNLRDSDKGGVDIYLYYDGLTVPINSLVTTITYLIV